MNMNALRFRKMTRNDLPAALEVRLSTVENAITLEEMERDYGVTPEKIAAAMDVNVAGWLCEEERQVLGFAMGNSADGEVLVVAVHPSAQGRGVGQGVLGHVADWLFNQGHGRVWLLSSPDASIRAYGFYRHLGWRPTGEMRGGDEVLELFRDV